MGYIVLYEDENQKTKFVEKEYVAEAVKEARTHANSVIVKSLDIGAEEDSA